MRKSTRKQSVSGFLKDLEHARKEDILALRQAILEADPRITEQIKWNAPSFCWCGDDRVTMRLHPGNRLELIFHVGAKAKAVGDLGFEDHTGLIDWVAPHRGVIRLVGASATTPWLDIAAIALCWMKFTTDS